MANLMKDENQVRWLSIPFLITFSNISGWRVWSLALFFVKVNILLYVAFVIESSSIFDKRTP